MFRRSLLPAWVSILALSGMFLVGQDTWSPQTCTDHDGDGYGNPASAVCAHPELDCDDGNENINPGATEAAYGDPMCGDGFDNDCDGSVDGADTGCLQCGVPAECDDGNPCTDDECMGGYCVNTNNSGPCDDGVACTEADICSGGACSGSPLDVDDDGYVSEACGGDDCDDANSDVYPGAPEPCDGIDNQCPGDAGYGAVDEYGCGGPMVQIPGGCFNMGDSLDGMTYALPVHNVCLSPFEMDVHEVTNAEYAACMDGGGCTAPTSSSSDTRSSYYGNPAYGDFPVIWVDWYKANAYCTWAGKRLPTEAEWEYAARGGLAGNRYPWGDTITCDDACWGRSVYWDLCRSHCHNGMCDNDTHPVENYAANGYGLFDMAGNVWEWTNDWYSSSYYQYCVDHGIVNDPPGPTTGSYRVLRGASWYSVVPWANLRVAYRNDNYPGFESGTLGLRCVR